MPKIPKTQRQESRAAADHFGTIDTDPEDAPITVVELHLVTAQHNSIIG